MQFALAGNRRQRKHNRSVQGGLEMKQVMVRYKVKSERAAENEELVRAVYAELHVTKPTGLRYATFQLDDGVSFVHLASTETADGSSALPDLPAFKRFQENIDDRCEERPVVTEIREIGSYRFLGD
jgi:hypothetical protein